MGVGTIRLGGALGVVSGLAVLPGLFAGSPEIPDENGEVREYVDSGIAHLELLGGAGLLRLVTGLAFLGVLVAVLRSAAGPTGAVYAALSGGLLYLTLASAGIGAEAAVPAAIVQFDDLSIARVAEPMLGLALWLYNFAQAGAAVLMVAVGYVVWRTGVLPKAAAALAVLAVPTVLSPVIGLPAAYAAVAWFVLTGLALLVLPPVVTVARTPAAP
ncbi:hypothetical protein [uncultured Mycolicibacterium sp.]|uniref:hypothetical protein n=1 Tax=uncultured Mycolicibacterium sp. TaxID=2320817 RepID=UPI002634C012|nr:hypothetical protein [uncultured Mycolicibacterium sp.]